MELGFQMDFRGENALILTLLLLLLVLPGPRYLTGSETNMDGSQGPPIVFCSSMNNFHRGKAVFRKRQKLWQKRKSIFCLLLLTSYLYGVSGGGETFIIETFHLSAQCNFFDVISVT